MTRARKTPPPQPVFRILVIDDEVEMLNNYRRMLERAGYECELIADPKKLETKIETFHPDLVLTDLVMPNGSGMDVLHRMGQRQPDVPVIVVTAHGSIENAVEAMKGHATDYLTKPFSIEELLGKIQTALSRRLIEGRTRVGDALKDETEPPGWRDSIIGASSAIERVLDLTKKVARTDVNALIVGESGTGKELFARAIHRLSARSGEIFVPVDCASLPENLLESELFGYCKGAFTDARSDKMGLFEFAHKGTLFLDEIGEMPISLQAKLLRVLQERTFRPIGGRRQIEVDVRVLAATNCDLEQALHDKTFRSDLYYRLNVITLKLPPLRDRIEDIPLLADHFLVQFAFENKLDVDEISTETRDCLKNYRWPGNVRELQNAVEHAATITTQKSIDVMDLPQAIQECRIRRPDESGEDLFTRKSELMTHFEKDYLISLLVDNHFNLSRAAKAAGCHRRTLYRMVHRHKIDLKRMRSQHRTANRSHSTAMTDTSAEPS